MDSRTIGILGGGQLGRMMVEASHRLGIKVAILDPGGKSSPAGQLADFVIEGPFNDTVKINELASVSDVLTVEIEHVNTEPLLLLEQAGYSVQPKSSTIKLIQDKYNQKLHLQTHMIALGEFMAISTIEDCYLAASLYGFPFVLKKRKLAYDGNGNFVVHNQNEVPIGFDKLGGVELYAEKFVPFVKEIAVMVARTQSNGVITYPVVETIQDNNICHLVIAPAYISENAKAEALLVASRAISTLSGNGIFGVELFLLPDDSILLNEIAPRPHNSGHYTMEACSIDQFEMHIRTVLDLPCPTPVMRVGASMMVNVLGKASMKETTDELTKAMKLPNVGLHWYGKHDNKLRRKMAHYTITGNSSNDLILAADTLGIPASVHGLPLCGPKIGIIMGSDSDLPTMKDAAEILDLFQVSYEIKIVSAHRTPSRMYEYAQTASQRGIQVIIAGAGGAAHLPGMVAAMTPLPVIGVPIFTSTLHGQDSLLSIVQMPRGIPVATVAIGNATNAALLAVRILGSSLDNNGTTTTTSSSSSNSSSGSNSSNSLMQKMEEYMLKQETEVIHKTEKLEAMGYKEYLRSSNSK